MKISNYYTSMGRRKRGRKIFAWNCILLYKVWISIIILKLQILAIQLSSMQNINSNSSSWAAKQRVPEDRSGFHRASQASECVDSHHDVCLWVVLGPGQGASNVNESAAGKVNTHVHPGTHTMRRHRHIHTHVIPHTCAPMCTQHACTHTQELTHKITRLLSSLLRKTQRGMKGTKLCESGMGSCYFHCFVGFLSVQDLALQISSHWGCPQGPLWLEESGC